jgi:serine/threonine protein kinase
MILEYDVSPTDYARIRELDEAAAAMDPSRRATFLGLACGDNPAIRSEVERLLQIADDATGFLSQPAALNGVGLDVAGTPAKRFTPGDLLGGRFEIQQHIATGGMGEVYRARDRNLDRDVALKVLPPHLSARADLVERLKREARAISSLNHPNICSLYDFCWHGDTGYLVMEYLEGKTLRDRIASGPCTVSELLDFAIQIAEGLVAAHARGLIHRDIKPANLFVTNRGQVKIMDFGLAARPGNCRASSEC